MRTLLSILSLLLLTCGLTSAVNLTVGDLTNVASWLKPLVITTVGDSKINVPSDYAIVRANIESELPIKVKEKESIVIGSGRVQDSILIARDVGSVPATLPALIPNVSVPAPSASNDTVVNATIIHAPPPAASNNTDIMTKVQQDVADKTQAVLDYLKKQGKDVWKIETQQVSVYPVYDYTQAPLSMVAYHASISLSFRVTVLHAGTVIDGITAAGVSRIDGVSYGVSDDKLALAEKSAITEAVENALERAQTALNAAKKEGKNKPTLNPIDINIQSVGTAPDYPRPLYSPIAYDKAASSGSATTPILAQETVVTANVIAKFEAK